MISYCPMCGKPVYFAERKRSLGKDYHPLCLKCYHCKRQLSPGQHAEFDDKPYCTHCSLQRFGPRAIALMNSVPGEASSDLLPEDLVMAPNWDSFERGLDKLLQDKGIDGH